MNKYMRVSNAEVTSTSVTLVSLAFSLLLLTFGRRFSDEGWEDLPSYC